MSTTVLEIFTDAFGHIRSARADTTLLGTLSQRGSVGRDIALFFQGNRRRVEQAIDVASRGFADEFLATWQPRDKASHPVLVQVRLNDDDRATLRWSIVAIADSVQQARPKPRATARRKGPVDSCECVVWRDDTHRCELWLLSGRAYLRVFDGPHMIREEPAPREGAYERAHALRGKRPALRDTPPIDDVPAPPLTTPDDTDGG